MEQYIPKSALVAEIERKIHTEQGYSSGDAECGYRDCAREILSFLNTLEVKEVDLEKELKNLDNTLFDLDGVAVKGAKLPHCRRCKRYTAKRFFELGLKVAQKGEEV